MDANDLVRTAGDLIANGPAADVLQVVGNAGGFMLKEGGKVVLGVLIRPSIEDMLSRFQQAKAERKIADDFETTDHGAALLQQALNALLEGLDHERAETVKKMFLGLAMNPVEDSLERIQQLEIMRITSELTAWEVALINALERYSKEFFDKICSERWDRAEAQGRNEIRDRAAQQCQRLDEWLRKSICKDDETRLRSLQTAFESLKSKQILISEHRALAYASREFVYRRQGAFTDFGWKIVVHVYSATEN